MDVLKEGCVNHRWGSWELGQWLVSRERIVLALIRERIAGVPREGICGNGLVIREGIGMVSIQERIAGVPVEGMSG